MSSLRRGIIIVFTFESGVENPLTSDSLGAVLGGSAFCGETKRAKRVSLKAVSSVSHVIISESCVCVCVGVCVCVCVCVRASALECVHSADVRVHGADVCQCRGELLW